jgi:hypothetical protein
MLKAALLKESSFTAKGTGQLIYEINGIKKTSNLIKSLKLPLEKGGFSLIPSF